MKTKTKKIGCQTDVKQNKQKKTEFYYTTMRQDCEKPFRVFELNEAHEEKFQKNGI